MRMIFALLIALLLMASAGCHSQQDAASPEMTVMSFNIRNGKANDGENSWPNRKAMVRDVIREYDADLVGLQEAFRFQLDYLAKELPGYQEVGEGRGGGTADEYSAILYRADRFDLLDSGTFWLSDTPSVVSKHWGHHHYRICTWARLRDRDTGVGFYLFNTHFDHKSQLARLNAAKLIAQRIADREHKDPVILTGDLNAGEDNHAVRYLKGTPYEVAISGPAAANMPPYRLIDTFRVHHPDATLVGTGNGGYKGRTDGAKIDYVFVGPNIETLSAVIDSATRNGRYPSDHYPVIAEIRVNKPRPQVGLE
ncbi:MAG: endonuclease/exonuclease/phosphatase family protein [Phycisphaeraceae bacterium]